ncbi:sigma-70 family RNA polymerase sigma factor, partial [Candidatus Woesebacteria bacterium]|nr:sigma-70 family RNA polymerase sigma factor [Candidatus Woesebacteria bacterium]
MAKEQIKRQIITKETRVENAFENLKALHDQKGFLIMYEHGVKKGLPRQDVSSVLEALPEEEAESLWERLAESKLQIEGIDVRPKVKKPRPGLRQEKDFEEPDFLHEDHGLRDLIAQASQEGLLTQRGEINLLIKRQVALRSKNSEELKAAEDELVNRNLGLILSIAKKYQGRGLDITDLFQEGYLGFQRAVEKADWRRGFKLSTYATWWVIQAISKAAGNAGLIRHPAHFRDKTRDLMRASAYLEQELGIENPSDDDLAKLMEISSEEVRNIKENWRVLSSLEDPVGEEENTTLGELIADPSPGPVEIFELEDEGRIFSARTKEVLAILTERERAVLTARHLSNPTESLSFRRVG